VLAIVVICMFAGVEDAQGQVNTGTLQDQLSVQLDEARVSLRSRNFQVAIPALREGLSLAQEENDKEFQARYHFQLGVALQQRSLDGRVAQDLNEAAGHYESYLKLKPKTGSALNNLAQIYTQLDREGEASSLFARAVALEDEMVGFYAFNYAEFLKERKAWGESANYYKKALEENPDHPEAREGLLEAYQRIDQGRLIAFIWDQIDEGRDVWATTASLQALSNLPSEDVRPQIRHQKEELLACVTVGMSRARYGPASKSKSGGTQAEVFQMLEKLASDEDIGPGVKEILSVFDAPSSPELSAKSWWADKGDRFQDPAEGWWPRDAYRMLIRSVGTWHERRKDNSRAEAYYLQSIHLTDNTDNEPDLQAIVQLADLYLASNQMNEIEALLNNTSTELFFGKGEAYKKSNFKKIFTFHRTLGIMYALTEQWGDSYTVTSAIFQLENALETRNIYNSRIARRQRVERLPIDSRLVNLLATAYTATGKSEEAAELQFTYLTEAVKSEDRFNSTQILRAIDYSTLDARQKRRYDRMRRSLSEN